VVRLSALRTRRTLLPKNVLCWRLSESQGLVRPEGLGKFRNITSSGIEPATFRFVAQCLNHYATACPQHHKYSNNKIHRTLLPTTYRSARTPRLRGTPWPQKDSGGGTDPRNRATRHSAPEGRIATGSDIWEWGIPFNEYRLTLNVKSVSNAH
jgi:hypothetical protein